MECPISASPATTFPLSPSKPSPSCTPSPFPLIHIVSAPPSPLPHHLHHPTNLEKQLHAYTSKTTHISSIFVRGALICLYATDESIRDAHQVFDECSLRNTTCLNTILNGYLDKDLHPEQPRALSGLKVMVPTWNLLVRGALSIIQGELSFQVMRRAGSGGAVTSSSSASSTPDPPCPSSSKFQLSLAWQVCGRILT